MGIKNSKQIRKRLEKEYNENCLKIDDLNEKIRIINANDFEKKVGWAIVFSIIPWFASILLTPSVIESAIISLNMVQPLFAGVTVLIGIVSEELFTRKSKYREKLREFSNSKTQKERIEESTRYEIEMEKLKNRNKILDKINDDLLEKENMISCLSESYNVTEKNDNNNAKELEENIENINNILQKKQQEVDVATTKSVLKEKFRIVRDKSNWFSNMLSYGMLGAIMCMLLYNMPIVYINGLPNVQLNIQFQTILIGMVSPFIIGELAGSAYYAKKTKELRTIFNNINEELGDNAISEFSNKEEIQFNQDLENIINETCKTKLQLETEKQRLENLSSISNFEEVMDNDDELTYDRESVTKENLEINDGFIDANIESFEKLLNFPKTNEQALAKKLTLSNDKKQ